MKYLKIEDNKGYFLREKEGITEWELIDQITKDDLFYLLNKAIDDDYEMDEYDEETLANKAHQIIYKNIHEKFLDLILNKYRFKDESEALYKGAVEKYRTPEIAKTEY
jgi:hypothetical protein